MEELKLCKEWIEEYNGVPMECKMFIKDIDGKTITGISRRPHVSPEQRKRNDAAVCRFMLSTFGEKA